MNRIAEVRDVVRQKQLLQALDEEKNKKNRSVPKTKTYFIVDTKNRKFDTKDIYARAATIATGKEYTYKDFVGGKNPVYKNNPEDSDRVGDVVGFYLKETEYRVIGPEENGKTNSILRRKASYTIDDTVLERSAKQLLETAIEKQCKNDFDTTEISFSVGYMRSEEWYKREIFKKAQDILKVDSWSENIIGNGLISSRIIDIMEMKLDSGIYQNLLHWREIEHVKECIKKDVTHFERVLYKLYTIDEEQLREVFDELLALLGDRFPILSFLFFIRDRKRFVPVKPNKFGERFDRIGVSTNCLGKCTWENYNCFLSILKDIQDRIKPFFGDNVELIDAHSFVWMMWHIDNKEPDQVVDEIVNAGDFESVIVSTGKEGLKKEFYGRKYERDPKLRREAIRIHKLNCEVCGFNFQKVYGSLGEDYIEVHHKKPLYTVNGETDVNPETDLACLCANCHRMIHHRRNCIMSIEELKEIIDQNT